MWERIKMDIKERFFNYETVKGIYMLPVGLLGLYITWNYVQFILYAIGFAYFGYMTLEGSRKISVNRIKQQVVVRKLIEVRKEVNSNLEKLFNAQHNSK